MPLRHQVTKGKLRVLVALWLFEITKLT